MARGEFTESEPGRPIEPFLRWAGGKRLLRSKLVRYLPADVRSRTYLEPFLGAASVYLAVRPRKALLSDLNEHLIRCYEFVRDAPVRVARYLELHAARNSSRHYYSTREIYNRSGFSAAQAARFIYLNKTCFNGVFRVNKRGQFNVPYGDKTNPIFPNAAHLEEISQTLSTAKLRASSYEEVLANAKPGDFAYLDPPYPPLNGTSYFTHYTPDRFGQKDQEALASVVRELDDARCLILMTNADTELVRKLYSRFYLASLSVTRYVTCKSVRHSVDELVITNYEPRLDTVRQLSLTLA